MNNIIKKAAIYTRVSTTHQSTELQERDIKLFLATKPEYQLAKHYRDFGVSGSKSSRPELNLLLEDARSDKFDVLIIWKLDRLARSLSHLITLITELKRLNIELISLRDNIDFTTAQGRLMFGIFASLAEFERELIRERVIAGLETAKANGKALGRKKDNNRDDTLISELKVQGLSIRSIASKLNITPAKVQRSLKCIENL